MIRAPRVGPPEEAKETILRVAPGFGWFGLGVLAAGATAWVIFSRTGRSPSNGQEPDGDPTAKSPTWCWTSPSWRSTG